MLLAKRHNQWIEIAADHLVQLVQSQINAVVRNAPLREIVGSDAL